MSNAVVSVTCNQQQSQQPQPIQVTQVAQVTAARQTVINTDGQQLLTNELSDLDKLILKLRNYYPYTEAARPDHFRFVLCYSQLVEVLEKINAMVGMRDIKDDLAARFRSMAVYYAEHGMINSAITPHTLLMSEPGMGKTQIGSYICEFWTVVGAIRRPPSCSTDKVSTNFKWSTIDAEAELRNGFNSRRTNSLDTNNDNITGGGSGGSNNGSDFNSTNHQQQQLTHHPTVNKHTEAYTLLTKSLEERANTMVNRIQRHSHSKHPTIRREYQELKTLIHRLADNQIAQEVEPLKVALMPNSTVTVTPWWKLPEKRVHSIFRVTTKADFISRIQGGSTYQLRRMLKECEGGCIMIDEAYSIVTSDEDSFGKEVLAEIVSVMSTYDCIMFIFAGYKGAITELTRKQQGLMSRFNYIYEIAPYTNKEIYDIFSYHCRLNKLEHAVEFDADIFNVTTFPAYGRDISALVKVCNQRIYDNAWDQLTVAKPAAVVSVTNVNAPFSVNRVITKDIFDSALKLYTRNKNPAGVTPNSDKFYHHAMYS